MTRWEEIEDQVRSIEGWLLDGQDRWLFETAKALPPESHVLEVGPFKGRSTAALAFGCRDSGCHVFSIDTFEGNTTDFIDGQEFEGPFIAEFTANMEGLGLLGHVSAFVGRSSGFWKTWSLPLHFVFIDGSHQYADVRGDFIHFYRRLVPCGILALHDIDPFYPFPGPREVWNRLGTELLENRWTCMTTLGYGFKPCSR